MKHFWVALIAGFWMCVFALAADAQTINCQALDMTTMTPQQLENAQQLCKQQSVVQSVVQTSKDVTPDKVREWGRLGKDLSTAIVDTAKGLGQTANEFLFTPVGIMIAFYFMWSKIGGIIIGIPLIIALWTLYCSICNRYSKDTVEYVQVPVLWGAFSIRKVSKIVYNDATDVAGVWSLLAVPTMLVTWLLLGTLVF